MRATRIVAAAHRAWAAGCSRRLGLAVLVATACGVAASVPAAARAGTLPDGRAFELVSPPNTNGNPAIQSIGGTTEVVSDDQVIYGEGVDSDGPSGSGFDPVYLATRGADGWSTTSLLPGQIDGGESWGLVDATQSLSAVVFATGPSAEFVPPPPTQEVPNQLVYRDAAGDFSTFVSIPYGGTSTFSYSGMSADGQTVIYEADVDPSGNPTAGGLETVYAWHPDGSVAAIEGGSGDALAGCSVSTVTEPNDVSADGSTVFLASGSGTGSCPTNPQVYASVDGHSQEISVSTDGTADSQSSAASATFIGATPDGDTAYFTTTQPLTASAGGASTDELYEWTAASGGQPAQVTCLSCAATDDQGVDGGTVVSTQGDYVYFQAFNPNSSPGGSSAYELLVYHAGTVEVVDSDQQGYLLDPANTQLSPDGSVIVYTPDEDVAGGTTPFPLYRAVVSGSSVSTPQCIACGTGGTPVSLLDIGDTSYRGASTIAGGGDDAISADGDTVVFETTDALGAADDSDQVYEWTPSGGDQFIADGYAGTLAGDAAITPDAQNIFFYSPDSLIAGIEQPGVAALYDARIGGGFPAAAAAASCSGDACQGPSPSATSPAPTTTSACCGDVSGRSASLAVRAPSAAQLRAAARTGTLSLRLRVHGAGRLRIRVTAELSGRRRTVATTLRRIHAARLESLVVRVRLNATAVRALDRSGRLRVELTASLNGVRAQTTQLTLRRATDRSSTGGRS